PEIEQTLRRAGAPAVRLSFTPTLVPMARGILATVTAPLTGGATAADVRRAWQEAYAEEPFVHLLPEGQWPTTAATLGANAAHVQVTVDERAGRVVAVCALDNLGKGTAGAAVQSMSLALGFPEDRGLTAVGVAPWPSRPPRASPRRPGSGPPASSPASRSPASPTSPSSSTTARSRSVP